jgi:DNA-binding CsgD family transcriptional regulator
MPKSRPVFLESRLEVEKSEPALLLCGPEINKSRPGFLLCRPAFNKSRLVFSLSRPAFRKSKPVFLESRPEVEKSRPAFLLCRPEVSVCGLLFGQRGSLWREAGRFLVQAVIYCTPIIFPRPMKTIYLRQRLPPRSMQVLQLLGRGLTDREVAEQLRITLGTLRNYLPHLRMMLGLSSLEEVRRVARDWGAGKIRIFAELRPGRLRRY